MRRDAIAGERSAEAGRGVRCQRIADLAGAGEVASAYGLRRDREGASQRSTCALAFVAREEEGAITDQRPPEHGAILILAERWNGLVLRIEIVPRIEHLVAEELEHAALKRVGACAGRDVDQGGGLAAELRRILRLLDLELLNGVDRRADDQVVEELVRDFDAVQQIDVVAGSLAADVRERPGLLQRLPSGSTRGQHDGVAQLSERQEGSAVERQLHHDAVLDDVADFRVRRLQERHVRGHANLLGRSAHVE